MKKFLSVFTLAMTLAMPIASHAQATVTLKDGDLIKGATSDTVYYFFSGSRYVFPNEKTYKSWFGDDFSKVKSIPMTQLTTYPLGRQNVTYRPGMQLLKITTDPRTYAVDKGGTLRHVENEVVAKMLFGDNWAKMVHDLPDPFFINYKIGNPIASPSDFAPQTVRDANMYIWQDKTWPAPSGY